jgi:hypothetical protein
MHIRWIPALLAGSLLLLASVLSAQRSAHTGMGSVAKLVVVVDGDTSDWGNWGFLWDAGERRNGRPWRPATGLLEPGATRSQASDSSKKIHYGITEEAWNPAIGPTEVELLQTIAKLGYQLVEVTPGAQHELIPLDFAVERATTYWFQRKNG